MYIIRGDGKTMKKSSITLLVTFCILLLSSGCIDEKQSTLLPQQHSGALEIIEYTITTQWTEGESEHSLLRHSKPGFFHQIPQQTNLHSISYWIECHLHNQFEADTSPVIISLTFLDENLQNIHSHNVTFEEGLAPKENRWFTIIINKEKEENKYAFDFTQVTDVELTAYLQQ